MVNKYTIISIFAGGGGSSLGYQMAGFKELLAIDYNPKPLKVLKENFKFPIWERDIRTVTANEIMEFCNLQKGELDILDGSPPCQGFSVAGKREVRDDRNNLYIPYIELIKNLSPKVFIMENVTGMIYGSMKGKFLEIISYLKRLNYEIKIKMMNSKYYEVPQMRKRIFFIGIRKDLKIIPSFPTPSKKIILAQEAIKDLEDKDIPEISHIRRPLSKTSKSYLNWLTTKYGKSVIGQSLYKIHPNRPSNTIKGSCLFHYKENRLLTVREYARLSSFPDNFKLPKFDHSVIGNAVMPKMMFHIAKHIKKNVLDIFYLKNRNT